MIRRFPSLRPRRRLTAVLLALVLMLSAAVPSIAQDVSTPSPQDDNSQPAPASVGADAPLSYFGPVPSEVQKELIGPYQLLKSGNVDIQAGTTTIPLYLGHLQDGTNIWYILTDTNDKGNADALGLNYSAKLGYAGVSGAIRDATLEPDATLTFDRGTVDFGPEHQLVPGDGDAAFPPKTAEPGSVGDADYSPLIRITNAGGTIYNAPIVAMGDADNLNFCDGNPDYSLVHDHVKKFCPQDMTVTMSLVTGFSFGRPVLYLSTDSNDKTTAAIEDATLAPGLKKLQVGLDDGAFSPVERIFIATNGPTGADNPQRQGLNSALTDGGGPLNVFGGIPTVATDYSPMWDANVYTWSDDAVSNGYRARNLQEFEILGLAQEGWITGPGGSQFGSTGIIIDCAVVMRLL